jgi:hypothetical protein
MLPPFRDSLFDDRADKPKQNDATFISVGPTPTSLSPNQHGSYQGICCLQRRSCNFGHLAYRVDDIYEDGGVVTNRPLRDGHMALVRSHGISIDLL